MQGHRWLVGGVLLALLLGACNSSTQAPSEQKYQVAVTVDFGRRASPSGLAPQGVPWLVDPQAIVKVVRQSDGVELDSCALSLGVPSCTLQLPPDTYTFQASVRDGSGPEVAWVSESHSITGNATISLIPKTILADAFLSADTNSAKAGTQVAVRLWATYPGGPQQPYAPLSFPLDDIDGVAYTVGTCTDSTCSSFTPDPAVATLNTDNPKLGAMVEIAQGVSPGTWVGIKAVITGLGEDHQPKTLTRYFAIQVADPNSVGVGVSMDLDPPWVSSVQIDGQSVGYPAQVGMGTHTLSGTAWDNQEIADLKVYINFVEVPVTVSGLNTPSAGWSYLWTPPAPGRYYLYVVAHDGAGNSFFNYLPIDVQ